MTKNQIKAAVYRAAHRNAVLVDRSDLGMLRITGETRLDLIHRMSTQDLNGLQSGEGAATILTTDIGRIIDRLLLYVSSQAVYALTSEENADNIARYLMRFVFFNDDFQVRDISGETAVFAVYGPKAGEKLLAAGFPEVDLPLHHWREVTLSAADDGAVTAFLHRTDPIAGDGYFVMSQAAEGDALWGRLLALGLTVADDVAFDYLRIEDGRPRFDHELTGDYIPLEAGLWDDVSFNKGCYTGQEIIARLESRGRLAKKLVGLRSAAPVAVGAAITAAGKNAGLVTSAGVGPAGPMALGFVKTAVLEADTPLLVGETAVATQPLV